MWTSPGVPFWFLAPANSVPLLQGTSDSFLKQQLKPENFSAAAAKANYPVILRMQPLYDHSYYFISTFMRDHIDFHARAHGLTPKHN